VPSSSTRPNDAGSLLVDELERAVERAQEAQGEDGGTRDDS